MPASTIEIRLSEPLDAFVNEQAESGGYHSPADFIQNLVETARQHEENEAQIDAKILEAFHSEHPGHLATPEFWEAKRARLQSRLDQARREAR